MAAINFPSGASNGATHYENGKLWTYDGTSWTIVSNPVTLSTPLNVSDAGSGSTTLYLVGSNATSGSGIAFSTDSSLTYNPNTNLLSINSGSFAANGVTIGSASNTINTASGNLTLDSVGGTVNINDNLIVSGDLTVNGTTTTVNSTVTSIVDPIIVLGSGAGNTHPSSDDNKDRGIEFRYVSGTAKTGFFGFDDSTGKFTFIPDGSNTSEVFSGSAGTAVFATVEADLIGTATTSNYAHQSGYAITSGTATTTQNIQVQSASTNTSHRLVFTPNNSASGVALSTNTTLVYNPSTDILSVSGLAVTSSLASVSPITGALIVTGGVGIGDSLFTSPSSPDSISGVILSNSVITSGSWAGSIITSRYGGTGFSTFNKGDLLVGDANSYLNRLPAGSDRSVLIGSSYSGFGLSWQALLSPTYGVFGSGATHQATATGTTVISYDTTIEANRVSITPTVGTGNTTRIYIQDSGTYLFQVTLQNDLLTTNQPKEGEFWFRINGVDRPDSNSRTTVIGQNAEQITSLQYVTTVIADTYVELVMYSSTADFAINSFYNLTSPTRPDIKSVIFSITPISNILPSGATGISGLASLNTLTSNIQTFAVGEAGDNFNISSLGSVHTFNIPNAGTSINRGLITNLSQSIAGSKTFTSDLNIISLTASTSTTSGSLVAFGGFGLSGNAFIGGTVTAPTFFGNLSGLAVTSTNFYGNLNGTATTASNVSLQSSTTNSIHPIIFTPTSNTSGSALSSNVTLGFNPSTASLYSSGLYVTSITSARVLFTGSGGQVISSTAFTYSSSTDTLYLYGNNSSYPNLEIGKAMGYDEYRAGIKLYNINAYSGAGGLLYSPSLEFHGYVNDPTPGFGTYYSRWRLQNNPYYEYENQLTIDYSVDNGGTPIWRNFMTAIGTSNLGINDTLYLNAELNISSATNSTSSATGSMVLSGGAGFGKSISVGGRLQLFNSSLYTAFVSSQSGVSTVYTLPSTTPSTGTSVLQSDTAGTLSWVPMTAGGGGAGTISNGLQYSIPYYPSSGTLVTGSSNFTNVGTGISILYPASDSTSITTGALVVSGGFGLSGNAFIGGTVTIANSTGSGSSSSGALVVRGGVGVSGNIYSGRNIEALGTGTFRSLTSGRVTFAGTNGLLSDDANFQYSTTTDTLTLDGTNVANPNLLISKTIASLGITTPGIRLINSTIATAGNNLFSPTLELASGTWGGSAFTARVKFQSNGSPADGAAFNITYSVDKGSSNFSRSFISAFGDTVNNSSGYVSVATNQLRVLPYATGSSSYEGLILGVDTDTVADVSNNYPSPSFVVIGNEWNGTDPQNIQARQYISSGSSISSPVWYLDLGHGYSIDRTPQSTNYTNAITARRFGPVSITQAIGATSTDYAALVVNGGLGVSGNAFIGGTVTIQNTTSSTSSSTGSMVLSGGAGFGKSINVSGNIGARSGFELRAFNSGDTNYSSFKYTGSTDTPYTLPTTYPSTGTSVLQSNTTGTLSWVPMTSGSGSPSGSTGDIQFNRSGSFGATTNLTYLENTSELRLDKFLFSGDPASNSSAAFRITGTNATFSGSVNGTYLAINALSGFTGNLIDAQVNGTSKLTLSNTSSTLSIPLSVTDATNSTTSSSGSLIATGGVGIGLSASIGGRLQLFNSSLYTAFVSSQSGVSTVYTLPPTTPSTGTSVLQSTSAGVLSWVPMTATGGGGAGTVDNGSANSVAYYPSTGSAVTGNNQLQLTGTGVTIGYTTNAVFSDDGSLTGALTVAGGVGIGGTLFVANQLGVGGTLDYTATNAIAVFTKSVNSYAQVIAHNHSNGNSASTDYIVSNDLSTDTSTYGDFGINSSGWAATTSAFNTANATYLASSGGDLAIGSLTANNIRFFYNNGINDVANFNGTDFGVFYGTNSTGTTTGAVNIRGGLGVTGNAFIGGTVTLTNTTDSIDYTTGALIIQGGLAVNKNLKTNTIAIGGTTTLSNRPGSIIGSATSNINDIVTFVVQNTGTGTSSAVQLILANDRAGTSSDLRLVKLKYNSQWLTGGGGALDKLANYTTLQTPYEFAIMPGQDFASNGYVRIAYASNAVQQYWFYTSNSATASTGFLIDYTQAATAQTLAAFVNRGGMYQVGNAFIGGTVTLLDVTNSTSSSTGSMVLSGGVGVGGTVSIGQRLTIGSTLNASSTSTGALVNSGGLGLAGNAFIGGTVTITDTTNSTSFSTGSLVLSGGAGFGKSINVSGNIGARSGFELRAFNSGDTNYSSFKYTGSVNTPYTLPTTYPSLSGQVLSSDTSGVMSWSSTAGFGTVNQKSISIFYPSTSDEITLMHTFEPITILQFETVNTGSGSALTYFVNFNSDRSSLIGTTVVLGGTAHTAGLAATTTGQAITSFTNASVEANQFIWLRIGSVTGTMNEFHFTMHYRKT